MVPSGEEMHTALECEVTIKPRFVYIPSPRTGPVRGGAWESRDGRGGRAGAGTRGLRAGARVFAAAAGGGGEQESGAWGWGQPSAPRAAVGTRVPRPAAGPRGGWRLLRAARASRGRRTGTRDPRQVPGARLQGVTDGGRSAPGQPKRLDGARGSCGAAHGSPSPGRETTVARPRALFPGTGV